jgi:hypothetical protein
MGLGRLPETRCKGDNMETKSQKTPQQHSLVQKDSGADYTILIFSSRDIIQEVK